MSSTDVTVRESKGELAVQGSMSLHDIVEQTRLIQEAMAAVMKDGEHYGVIPGTGNKPSLFKAGAEKLLLLFRLAPEYRIIEQVVQDAPPLIQYTIECRLIHGPSGTFTGSGIGSCSTRESKYRYKNTPTTLKPNKAEAEKLKAAGKGRWKKVSNEWVWHETVENDNPWEYQNTVLKMAQKRALVAAVLNSTAASDCFTQDVEDLPQFATAAPTAGGTAGSGTPVEGEGSTTPPPAAHFEPPGDVVVPQPPAQQDTPPNRGFEPPAPAVDVGAGATREPEPVHDNAGYHGFEDGYEPVEGEVHPPSATETPLEKHFSTREQAKAALLSGMIALSGTPGWSQEEILANATVKWQRPIAELDDLTLDEMRMIYDGMKRAVGLRQGGTS